MPLTLFKEKSPTVYRYYAFTFFSGLVFYTAVLVPFYTQWGGISLTQVQILQTWFMISALLLEIPTGVVADKYGRKHSVALGSITLAVAFILYGTIPRFEMFLVCEFLFGLGYALISGAGDALLYDTLKDEDRENETKQIFGKSQSIGLASGIIATIAGSIIASQFGLNIPMILSAIPVVIAAIFIWSIKEPRYKETDAKSPNYFSLAKNGIVYLSTHKILRLLALDSILVGAAAYFLVWLYQPLLQVIAFPIFY